MDKMDEWINGRTYEWNSEWIDKCINIQINKWNKNMNRWLYSCSMNE